MKCYLYESFLLFSFFFPSLPFPVFILMTVVNPDGFRFGRPTLSSFFTFRSLSSSFSFSFFCLLLLSSPSFPLLYSLLEERAVHAAIFFTVRTCRECGVSQIRTPLGDDTVCNIDIGLIIAFSLSLSLS